MTLVRNRQQDGKKRKTSMMTSERLLSKAIKGTFVRE